MTKPLNPEIKAIRAIHRALKPLDFATRRRILEWLVAYTLDLPGFHLPRERELRNWRERRQRDREKAA